MASILGVFHVEIIRQMFRLIYDDAEKLLVLENQGACPGQENELWLNSHYAQMSANLGK